VALGGGAALKNTWIIDRARIDHSRGSSMMMELLFIIKSETPNCILAHRPRCDVCFTAQLHSTAYIHRSSHSCRRSRLEISRLTFDLLVSRENIYNLKSACSLSLQNKRIALHQISSFTRSSSIYLPPI
jgi:hypothetical protein